MASIFIYNLKGGKCVELNNSRIEAEDIARLRKSLPNNLEGLAFESPLNKFDEDTLSEVRVEANVSRVAEYLRGIGIKLEKLQQVTSAIGFYDLAYQVSGNNEYLMVKARTLGQVGQVEKAERILKHYSKAKPEAPEPHFHFGKHALSRADYEAARNHFETAQELIRPNNIDHRQLANTLDVYIRFVSIYIDRDHIFARDLRQEQCMKEIQNLKNRTLALAEDIRFQKIAELDGMIFFLETQEKIFEKWLEEMNIQ